MKLIKIKDKNNNTMFDGGDIYIPAFNQNLQDLLIQYGSVFTAKNLPLNVEYLMANTNELIKKVDQIEKIQQSLVYALKDDYKAIIPWVFYSWNNIPEAYIPTVLQAHYNDVINIADYWQIGDTREYYNNGQKICYTIVDFNKDQLETAINGHTKSAITLFATTDNKIQPCCGGSSNSDWAYGFGAAVNTDLTEFIDFLTENNITDSYFNTANNFKTIKKNAAFISEYSDDIQFFPLSQKLHIPSYLELMTEDDVNDIFNPNTWHQTDSWGTKFKNFIKQYFDVNNAYTLIQPYTIEQISTGNIIPYFKRRSGDYYVEKYTNCTLRDTNSAQANYENNNAYRFKLNYRLDDALYSNEPAYKSNSDFGVLIINI